MANGRKIWKGGSRTKKSPRPGPSLWASKAEQLPYGKKRKLQENQPASQAHPQIKGGERPGKPLTKSFDGTELGGKGARESEAGVGR